jgi:hypothetical protein
MRKEVVFAIIAGILIGLLGAFGAWKAAKMLKPKPVTIIKKETPQTKKINNLTIDNYKDFDVVTNSPIINGVSEPNAKILITTIENDYFGKANENGEFQIEISIPAGLSKIKIYDLDAGTNEELTLVYSSEVEEGLSSYIGTVTDISSGTIQVKIQNGGIAQISIESEAKIINTLKKNIEIKETDIAIGDYIVGMGKISANKVLQAKRILVTSPISENKVKVEKIIIEKLTKNLINDITLPKKWNGPNIKELEVGQEIYIVGTEAEDKTYTLRSIFSNVE